MKERITLINIEDTKSYKDWNYAWDSGERQATYWTAKYILKLLKDKGYAKTVDILEEYKQIKKPRNIEGFRKFIKSLI